MPRTAFAINSPGHSLHSFRSRREPLQRSRRECCDRDASSTPLPLRRRREWAARAAHGQPANTFEHLRRFAAAATLPSVVQGCGAGAYGEQMSRRLCAPSRAAIEQKGRWAPLVRWKAAQNSVASKSGQSLATSRPTSGGRRPIVADCELSTFGVICGLVG
jgi:hypothetical protein